MVLAIIIGGGVFIWIRNQTPSTVFQGGEKKLSVTTSFYPLYFFATQIAGERADIVNVTPAGVEPHDYEPTSRDRARIEESQLLILNGGGLEAWGENIRKNIDPQRTHIVVAGEGLITDQRVEDGKTVVDPHVWLSPILAAQMVEKITQGFAQVDPANSRLYRSNADLLQSKLSALDGAYRQGLARCVQKNIITSHAAFGYLAQTYGLRLLSIAGLSPDAEPSTQELGNIAVFARAHDVHVIFFESLASPKLAETIATEIGATTLVLNPLEGLSESEIAAGENYLSVMEDNLIHLETALQCDQ